jgi:hypothetical protein
VSVIAFKPVSPRRLVMVLSSLSRLKSVLDV